MRILADENVDGGIVRWLRETGHDVTYAAEIFAAYGDDVLLSIARDESRAVITGDLDFGELIYHSRLVSAGIVLLRLRTDTSAARVTLFKRRWPDVEKLLPGRFVTVTPHRVRSRPLPPPAPQRPGENP